MLLEIGQLISNKYTVINLLGKGSMGEVYKVTQKGFADRARALKALRPDLMQNPELLTRFQNEARVMEKLNNRNIVRVYDIDHDAAVNLHYFVMEYIQGRTLHDVYTEKGGLPLKEVLSIARQLAQALDAAHNDTPPIIHRDIKPANIMLEDKTMRVVLMDFGIAKEKSEIDDLTKYPAMIGTVRYCSQEQMNYENLDGRADIYSLGMVLYEIYTGRNFFAHLNENQIISSVLSNQENIPRFEGDTPLEFRALIGKAIAKFREHRYRDMKHFLEDLEKCWELYAHEKPIKDRIIEMEYKEVEDFVVIDEKIHKLEQERSKRKALAEKTKCNQARQEADREDGKRFFPDLHQKACDLEIKGNLLFDGEEFEDAQTEYIKAAEAFRQAYQKSCEFRIQREIQEIQQQVQLNKAEADEYNAKEKARTLYGRALNFQSQAEELLERLKFREAYENFTQASQTYEDARELAYYYSQKEKVENLLTQVEDARKKAVEAEAERLIPAVFNKAFEDHRKGSIAFAEDNFMLAHEVFQSALQEYSRARRQVADIRNRQYVANAQKNAEEKRRLAEQAGGRDFFDREFLEAQKLCKAAAGIAPDNPEAAVERYGLAAGRFEEIARQTYLAKIKKQTEELKIQLGELNEKTGRLRKWANTAWEKADRLIAEAEKTWREQDFQTSAALFAQALEAHLAARKEAEKSECLEKAEAGRKNLADRRRIAEHCALAAHCSDLFQEAAAAEAKGQKCLIEGACPEALTLFRKAEDIFAEALAQRHRQLEQEIALALRQADKNLAKSHAPMLLQKGLDMKFKADGLWADSSVKESYDAYRQALLHIEEAAALASNRLRKKETEALADKARQAFDDAVLQGADTLASDLFQKAAACSEEGARLFKMDNFIEAKAAYDSAVEHYLAAGRQAIENLSRKVSSAREEARQIRKKAHDAGADERGKTFGAAVLAYQAGEKHERGQAYREALAQYENAGTGFHEALAEAEHEQKRKLMLEQKAKAQHESERAEQAGGRTFFDKDFAQAAKLLRRAEEHAAAENLDQSIEAYRQAAQQFAAIGLEARTLVARRELENRRLRAEKLEARLKPFKSEAGKAWNNAQKIKKNAEKAVAGKDYELAIRIYDDLFRTYGEVESGIETAKAKRLRRRHERDAVRNWMARKKLLFQRLLVQRRVLNAVFVFLLLLAGYQLISSTLFLKWVADFKSWMRPALKLTEFQPSANELTLADGQSQRFTVDATSAGGAKPGYKWYLDGKEQSDARTWEFKAANSGQEQSIREVKVVITGSQGQILEKSWRLNIMPKPVNHAPAIVKSTPAGSEITGVKPGDAVDFEIAALDEDPRDAMVYRWYLNGKEVGRENRWRFVAPDASGRFDLAVRVFDKAGLSAQRFWRLETSAPVADKPLEILDSAPDNTDIVLDQDQVLNFSIAAAGGDAKAGLAYAWLVDGKLASRDPSWRYSARHDGKHTVTAIVSDASGRKVQKHWELTVNKKPKNNPPELVAAKPKSRNIVSMQGDTLDFSVRAADPDAEDRLSYDWLVNGRPAAKSQSFQFKAAVPGKYTVTARVADRFGMQVSQNWKITVNPDIETPAPNTPPKITLFRPRGGSVEVSQGDSVDFVVGAADKDANDSLSYGWQLDGVAVSAGKFWTYKANVGGRHVLTVSVEDKAGLKDQKTWDISVTPAKKTETERPEVKAAPQAPAKTAPPEVKAAPRESAQADNVITENEVNRWLDNMKAYWNAKNVKMLVSSGVISAKDAGRLENTFNDYRDFHVAIRNISTVLKGNEAAVSFSRVDTIDGETITHPPYRYVLEKRPDGRVVRKQ